MLNAPIEGIELRHTLREKLQMSLSLAAVFLVADLGEFWFRPETFKTPTYTLGKCLLMFVVTYGLMNHQFIGVDASGITARYLLFTKRVLWQNVSSYAADWSVHFDGLASSYGAASYRGLIALKDNSGKRLLKLKVNCGPVEMRKALKQFMEVRLINRGITI